MVGIMFNIKVREVFVGFETFNEANGELAFFDTLAEIEEYAEAEELEIEFAEWDDEEVE